MSKPTLVIFGALSTALEIAELARMLHPDWSIVHSVGNKTDVAVQTHIAIDELKKYLEGLEGDVYGIVSMANMPMREERVQLMIEVGIEPLTLIHPSATISPSAEIGTGCYIAAGSRISTNSKIGNHCMLNLNVTFGHDAVCGAHSVINPGAAISGNVVIGERVLVGANSFIFQGLEVCDDAQIDAMTYVSRDIPARHVATSRNLKVYPRRD